MLPNEVCFLKDKERIITAQCMLDDYSQVISIPKDISPDGHIKLNLNPTNTNDIVSFIEASNADEDFIYEFLTYDRYEELAEVYGDAVNILELYY